jgi:hypothetical protein
VAVQAVGAVEEAGDDAAATARPRDRAARRH